MQAHRFRVAVLVAAAALLAAAVTVIVWRSLVWDRAGSAGLIYQSVFVAETAKNKTPPKEIGIGPFVVRDGEVMAAMDREPAQRAGIKVGDLIVAINGVPRREMQELQKIAEVAQTGSRVVYTIERKGKRMDIPLVLESPMRRPVRLASVASSVLVACVFLTLAVLVYWMRPGDRRAFIFFFLCMTGSVYFLISAVPDIELQQQRGIGPTQMLSPWSLGLLMLFGLLAMLLSCLLLHLSLIFPRENPVVVAHPRVVRWVYGGLFWPVIGFVIMTGSLAVERAWAFRLAIPCIALLVIALMVRARRAADSWKTTPLAAPVTTMLALTGAGALFIQPIRLLPKATAAQAGVGVALLFGGLYVVTWLGYSLITVAALITSYRKSNVEEKRQVRWPLWGTVVGVGGAGLVSLGTTLLLATGIDRITSSATLMAVSQASTKLLYVLIPLSFAFAILKYRLMEIDIVIKKTVVYTLVSGIVVALYLILVAGLGTMLLRMFPIQSQAVTIVSTLAVAALFVPLRNRVQKVVDRSFFRSRQDHAQFLRTLTREVHEAADLGSMLQHSAERLQQALQSRSIAIFIRVASELKPRATVGLSADAVSRVVFDEDPAWLATLSGAKRTSDPTLGIPADDLQKLRRIRAEMLVPLRTPARDLGVITLGGRLSDLRYDDDDADFIASAAEQIALAAETLRLRTEEEDFEKAREIQRGLLPQRVPQIAGLKVVGSWLPARTVSGDYFDVIRLSETKLAVCIADVAGKGMPAALLMSSLQAAVRAIAADGVPPRQLCDRVGRVIAANVTSGRFITFFFGVIDASRRTFTYCNAGHNPAILMRADGEVIRLSLGGPVFGRLFQHARYLEEEIDLRSGDRLVLYTDGVTEARGETDEDFGEQRLLDVIRSVPAAEPSSIERAILDAVTAFGRGELGDDVTMVVAAVE